MSPFIDKNGSPLVEQPRQNPAALGGLYRCATLVIISLLLLLAGCAPPTLNPPAETGPPPTDVPTAARPAPSASATATPVPTKTNTATMAVTPKFWTPGPTPTAVQVIVPPGECVVSPPLRGNAMDVQKVGETLCFVWADEYENETGFRVMLQFGYNGEVFLYDLPANSTGMPFPAVLLEPLGQSFEYCMQHKDYDVTLYVLLPDQEAQPITGFGFGGECNRFDMPSATPQPALTEAAATETVDLPPILAIEGLAGGTPHLARREGAQAQVIAGLGSAGVIQDALRVGQTVLVLTEEALLVVDLQTGQVETAKGLPASLFTGTLIANPNQQRVIVLASFGPQPPDGGLLLEYSPATRSLAPLLPLPAEVFLPYNTSMLAPVGLTDDHLLYLIPLGGDPSFGEVIRYDLERRRASTLVVGSSEYGAVLSPDGRFLVMQGVEESGRSADPLTRGIRLFSLYPKLQPEGWIELPHYPSQLLGMIWSPDSRFVYFSIDPSQAEIGDPSFGIWKLDIQRQEFALVAENDQVWSHPMTLSEDGQWLLLWPEFLQEFIAVNLSSGAVVSIPKPQGGALLVRNR